MTGIDILNHWEKQYFKHIDPKVLNTVAWSDEEAFGKYINYRWVYDKEKISNVLGYQVLDLNDYKKCDFYPVIVKPRINMSGMGKWAYKADNSKDLNFNRKNMIIQKYFEGTHLTTDFCVRKGKVLDYFTYECYKDKKGSFDLFEAYSSYKLDKCGILPQSYYFIENNLQGYTGFVNIETIGFGIIEVHLRPSTQYFDICSNMLERFSKYLSDNESRMIPSIYYLIDFEKTYSKVYRKSNNCIPILGNIPKYPQGVSSIQLCFDNNCPLSDYEQDNFSYLYLVINGDSLDAIKRFGKVLNKRIKFDKV